MNQKVTKIFLITAIVTLYLVTSVISTLHVIEFFELSNPHWLAITLAVAFEIGAAAMLASLTALDRINKTMVWILFIVLTLVQINGNLFYAYTHLHNYQNWVELFGLSDSDPIQQKRLLAIISGAILPLIALGFIKSLVDYLRPATDMPADTTETKPPSENVETKLSSEDEWIKSLQSLPDLETVPDAPVSEVVQKEEEAMLPQSEPIIEEPIAVKDETVTEELPEPSVTVEQKPKELGVLDKIRVFKDHGNK